MPTELDLDKHLSDYARRRVVEPLSVIVKKFHGVDGVIGMHGGLPPPEAFPITQVTLSHGDTETVISDPEAMTALQQYTVTPFGYSPLRSWLREHVASLHRPAQDDFTVMVTDGASHSIELLMRMFVNPGQSLLMEEFMFPFIKTQVSIPCGYVPLGVPVDGEGIIPEALERAIVDANSLDYELRPRVLYTVPHAQNPTGSFMSMSRKQAVYDVCSRHDIIIIEDDPYIYLQFPSDHDDVPGLDVEPGFMHIDVDKRVIRIDTFAKIIAPGLRLGWVSASQKIVDILYSILFGSTMGASGPSQVLTYYILKSWGNDGFDNHIRGVQRVYKSKATALHDALTEHMGGLATWNRPQGGMFLWLTVPGVKDAYDMFDELVENKVVVVPGAIFAVRANEPGYKCNSARLAFSMASIEQLQEGARRLASGVRAAVAAEQAASIEPDKKPL